MTHTRQPSHRLDRLSAHEIDSLLQPGPYRWGALLPVGCTEQHGPYLPVGCDTAISRGLAEHLAQRLSGQSGAYRALVLPDFAYTPSPGAESMAGTVTTSFDSLGRMLSEIILGALNQPFEFVALINSHAHNHGRVIEASISANARWRNKVALAIHLYNFVRLSHDFGLEPGNHAGEFEIACYHYYCGLEQIEQKDLAHPEKSRPPLAYGLEIAPRSMEGIIADSPPRVHHALQKAGELGNALDSIVCQSLVGSLDVFFAEWAGKAEENKQR